IKNGIKFILLSMGFVFLLLSVQCKKGEAEPKFKTLKVDLDFSGRRLAEVNDPFYKSWMIEQGNEAKKTFDQVHIAFSGPIESSWYKAGVQAPHYARLVNDGLISKGPLLMKISGLKPGKHSLLTFHNTFD